jgi:hypothetical protein
MAVGNILLFVAYAERGNAFGLFRREEQTHRAMPMTPAAAEAAARADRDAQPLTLGDLKRMKRTPQAKIIRRTLA